MSRLSRGYLMVISWLSRGLRKTAWRCNAKPVREPWLKGKRPDLEFFTPPGKFPYRGKYPYLVLFLYPVKASIHKYDWHR